MSAELLDQSVEQLRDSELRQQVLAVRSEQIQEQLGRNLAVACYGFMPSASNTIRDAAAGSVNAMGRSGHTGSRLQHQIINVAANELGVHISNDDSALDKTSGISQLKWSVNPDNGLGVDLRYFEAEGTPSLAEAVRKLEDDISEPFIGLYEELQRGSKAARTKEFFDLEVNADLVATFMGMGNMFAAKGVAGSMLINTLYDSLPVRYPYDYLKAVESGAGIYLDQDGNVQKILKEIGQTGVYRGIYFEEGASGDPTSAPFNLGVEYSEERARLDYSIHDAESTTEPFLDTKTGSEFMLALDASGLRPNKKLVDLLAGVENSAEKVGNKRYGNSYSDLSREVAKYVNNPQRPLSRLFEGDEESARQLLLAIDPTTIESGPASLMIIMLQDAVARSGDTQDLESSIPVHEGQISMTLDSCKDAEVKFVDIMSSNGFGSHRENLGVVPIGPEVTMLHKVNNGGATAINATPIMYKGIFLPTGSLFQRHKNEQTGEIEYAFVRVTSFTFDAQDARDAFTWQYLISGRRESSRASSETLKSRSYLWLRES